MTLRPVQGGQRFAPGRATTPSPDTDVDLYQLEVSGGAGQQIDVVLNDTGDNNLAGVTLELLSTDGSTVLATGSPNVVEGTEAENFDLGILGFEVSAAGEDLPESCHEARVVGPLSQAPLLHTSPVSEQSAPSVQVPATQVSTVSPLHRDVGEAGQTQLPPEQLRSAAAQSVVLT